MIDTARPAAPRALITGVGGFSGRHLARLLCAEGYAVAGLDRGEVADLGCPEVELMCADLRDAPAVAALIGAWRPQVIFHLAGLVRSADLAALIAHNVLATDSLLRAALALQQSQGAEVRVVIAGSAAEYGLIGPAELPIREGAPQRPITPYGISKQAQTSLGLACWHAEGLPVLVGRLFNTLGPGEPPTMVASAMARQVAAIARGAQEPTLRTGNLSAERDFVDIRDVVRAYLAIGRYGEPGQVYNICSGAPTPIARLPELLLELAGATATIRHDPQRAQRADVPRSFGCNRRLREATGWSPQISLRQSLADLLAEQALCVGRP